jgi:N6-adenosine-specific RNA methylase IME4
MKIDPTMLTSLPFELQAEISENLFRKDWTPSEIDAVRRRCEAVLKEQAKENQTTAGPRVGRGAKRNGGGKFPRAVKGKTRDKIGAFAGISGRTLDKIAAVVTAAEAEPVKYGKYKEDMDRTGRVDGAYRRLRAAQQAEIIRAESPPLPGNGPYRVGVVDTPWPFESNDEDPSDRGVLPYTTMSIADICALPIASIMHADSVLWLWTTNFHMRDAFTVLDAWGFRARTILTWAKHRTGYGQLLRSQTEHCILATRGKPTVTLTNQSTLLNAPMRAHSEKPAEFYDLVESLCPAPRYADLFSRYRHNDMWDCHGAQAPPNPGEMPDIPDFLRRTAE